MKALFSRFGVVALGFLAAGIATWEARAQALDQEYLPGTLGNTIIAARYNAAQTFTVGKSGILTQVELPLGQMDNPYARPLTLDIREVTAEGVPVEADSGPGILTTITVPAAIIPASDGRAYAWITFDVPDIVVTSGQRLAIAMRTEAGLIGAPDDVPFVWNADSTGAYAFGGAFVRGASAPTLTWSAEGNWDYGFRTFFVPVPEPATNLLLVFSGFVFLQMRRRIAAS